MVPSLAGSVARITASTESGEKTKGTENRRDGRGNTAAAGPGVTVGTERDTVTTSEDTVMTGGRVSTKKAERRYDSDSCFGR